MRKLFLTVALSLTLAVQAQEIKLDRHFEVEDYLKENPNKYISLHKLERVWEDANYLKRLPKFIGEYSEIMYEKILNSVEDQLYLEGYILRESKSRNAVILTSRCHGELL